MVWMQIASRIVAATDVDPTDPEPEIAQIASHIASLFPSGFASAVQTAFTNVYNAVKPEGSISTAVASLLAAGSHPQLENVLLEVLRDGEGEPSPLARSLLSLPKLRYDRHQLLGEVKAPNSKLRRLFIHLHKEATSLVASGSLVFAGSTPKLADRRLRVRKGMGKERTVEAREVEGVLGRARSAQSQLAKLLHPTPALVELRGVLKQMVAALALAHEDESRHVVLASQLEGCRVAQPWADKHVQDHVLDVVRQAYEGHGIRAHGFLSGPCHGRTPLHHLLMDVSSLRTLLNRAVEKGVVGGDGELAVEAAVARAVEAAVDDARCARFSGMTVFGETISYPVVGVEDVGDSADEARARRTGGSGGFAERVGRQVLAIVAPDATEGASKSKVKRLSRRCGLGTLVVLGELMESEPNAGAVAEGISWVLGGGRVPQLVEGAIQDRVAGALAKSAWPSKAAERKAKTAERKKAQEQLRLGLKMIAEALVGERVQEASRASERASAEEASGKTPGQTARQTGTAPSSQWLSLLTAQHSQVPTFHPHLPRQMRAGLVGRAIVFGAIKGVFSKSYSDLAAASAKATASSSPPTAAEERLFWLSKFVQLALSPPPPRLPQIDSDLPQGMDLPYFESLDIAGVVDVCIPRSVTVRLDELGLPPPAYFEDHPKLARPVFLLADPGHDDILTLSLFEFDFARFANAARAAFTGEGSSESTLPMPYFMVEPGKFFLRPITREEVGYKERHGVRRKVDLARDRHRLKPLTARVSRAEWKTLSLHGDVSAATRWVMEGMGGVARIPDGDWEMFVHAVRDQLARVARWVAKARATVVGRGTIGKLYAALERCVTTPESTSSSSAEPPAGGTAGGDPKRDPIGMLVGKSTPPSHTVAAVRHTLALVSKLDVVLDVESARESGVVAGSASFGASLTGAVVIQPASKFLVFTRDDKTSAVSE